LRNQDFYTVFNFKDWGKTEYEATYDKDFIKKSIPNENYIYKLQTPNTIQYKKCYLNELDMN